MKKRKFITIKLLSIPVILALLLPIALFARLGPGAQAADSGWLSPSADAADTGGDGDGFEENPTYAYADDASSAANRSGADDRHRYYNFRIESVLPSTAIITGIQVRLDGWVDHAASSPQYEVELSWDGGSTWSSALSTPLLTGAEETYILGAQSDLWGHAWSASELANTNFCLRIASRDITWPNRHFFLDWVAVRIYYVSAQINGTIWEDNNANGIQDGTETGLNGVHVTIYRDDGDGIFEGGSQDPETGSDDTDSNGDYDTGPFAEGYSYWIDVDAPENHDLTTPPEPRLVNLPDGDSVTVDFGYAPEVTTNPDIEIAKTPDTQMLIGGAAAAFTISITNTGDVTLTNVIVSDALAANCEQTFAELAVGENESYDCTLAGVAADFTNTASVTATPPSGPDVSDSDTAFVDVINPGIEIAKTPDMQTAGGDFTATFTIAITNTGDVTLTNVTVTDPLAPNCAQTFAELAAGGHETYTCVLGNIVADLTNTALVSGTPPSGPDVSDSDTAAVRLDRTEICPADMIAYWRLDETGGSVFDDFFDGQDAGCAGQCPAPVAGHINGGQEFDGSSTGINVPADEAFDWAADDSFSIEFWMQTESASTCAGTQVVIGRDDTSNSNLHWWAGCEEDTGRAAFYLRDTGGSIAYSAIGYTDLTDGAWHHIAAMRDAAEGEIRIYVDGLEEAATATAYATGFSSLTAALNIGWLNLSGGFHFDGVVDEVALYDRALSSDEVQGHHDEGLAGRWYCEIDSFAPSIVSIPVAYAAVGKPYSYNVEAVGNPAPTYTLLTNPGGMTIDPASGLIFWTPATDQEGDYPVVVEAANSEGTDTQDFTVTVMQGLLAYWRLDETGGTIYDDSFDGHDGNCAGTCPAPAAGHKNGSQEFDGSNTGIDISASEDFDWGPTDSFSIEFWMQTDSSSTCAGNQVIVGRDDNSSSLHWWVGCGDGGQAVFYLIDSAGHAVSVTGISDLTDGAWHEVLAVRDAGASEMRLYVDETREGEMTTTFAAGFDSTTAALNIGWLNLSGGFHFDGILDEIILYDVAIDNVAQFPPDWNLIFLPIVLRN